MVTPATRYRPSEREFPEKLPTLEFSPDDVVRLVKRDGALSFANLFWYVGEAFKGERVGVRETADGIEVRYGPYLIGTIPRSNSSPQRRTASRPRPPLAPDAGGKEEPMCQ